MAHMLSMSNKNVARVAYLALDHVLLLLDALHSCVLNPGALMASPIQMLRKKLVRFNSIYSSQCHMITVHKVLIAGMVHMQHKGSHKRSCA